jgi:hypothetical protein
MRLVKIVPALVCAAAAALLCGCSEPAVFAEALQLKQGDKVYTNYNIWYTDPDDISCLNIQEGSFIPVGTEIEPMYTRSSIFGDRIYFKDTAGREYSISFDVGHRMVPMRDYIAYTFTTKNRTELLKDVPEVIRPRVLRGEVVPGMNQAQVLLAYGPPPAIRTPDLRNESWIYWIGRDKTVRLVFRGDKVRNIININRD